jgi:hypothetical protein
MNGTRISMALAGCIVLAEPSYAYLDPGTGSIILQSLLAGIAVTIGVLRLYWYRCKAFLSGLRKKPVGQVNRDEQEFGQDAEITDEF